jgi:hypothetical protein
VDFRWAVVNLNEKGPIDACDNGEANFSWSRFEAPVNFYGARFHGPTVFWRTMFRDSVKLESTRFDSSATFQASSSQVCLEALDFPDKEVFFELHKAGLLWQDEDDSFCANMPGMGSSDELRKRLAKLRWAAKEIYRSGRGWLRRCISASP